MGVVVGTIALFLVLSVFSGLKTFSNHFLSATDPDIRITASKGKSFLFTNRIKETLDDNKDILSYTKIIEERAFFKYGKKEQIAYIKGVDSNYTKVVKIDSLIFSGNWIDFNSNTALVGNGIGNKLSIGILNYGEPLHIYVPKPGKKYIGNPDKAFKKVSTQAVGVFSISEELDNKFVFTSLNLSQELLDYKNNQIGAIDIKNKKGKTISLAKLLKKKLGADFNVLTREELNAVFYKILNTGKTNCVFNFYPGADYCFI